MLETKINSHKECRVCGTVKPISEFSRGTCRCKPCTSKRARDRYHSDPEWREHILKINRKRQSNNSDRECSTCGTVKPAADFYNGHTRCKSCETKLRRERRKDPDYRENINKRARDRARERRKDPEYRKHMNQRARKRNRERRANDPQYKLAETLRGRVCDAIKKQRTSKSASTLELLGVDAISVVREHLEQQFRPGMTWDNHGLHGWHIDHIRPVSSFDLTDPEQQRTCFHYTNLQPLWAEENICKGDKW